MGACPKIRAIPANPGGSVVVRFAPAPHARADDLQAIIQFGAKELFRKTTHGTSDAQNGGAAGADAAVANVRRTLPPMFAAVARTLC